MPQEAAKPDEHGGPAGYWLGVYYPAGYTIAVIDDLVEAQACVNDLVDLGIPAADVEVITGAEALRPTGGDAANEAGWTGSWERSRPTSTACRTST